MVDAGLHRYIYSPPPVLLQRQYSVGGQVPNRCLDWSVIASVLILSVASRLGVFRRNVTVSGTDMGAFGAMTEVAEVVQ